MTTTEMTFAEADAAATRLETAVTVRRQNNGGFDSAESAALARQAASIRSQSAAAFDAAASADLLSQPAGGPRAQAAHQAEQNEAAAAAAPAQRAQADRIASRIFADVKGDTTGDHAAAANLTSWQPQGGAPATPTADVAKAADAGDDGAVVELGARATAGDAAAWHAITLP